MRTWEAGPHRLFHTMQSTQAKQAVRIGFTETSSCGRLEAMRSQHQHSEPVDLEEAVKLYYQQVYRFALHLSKKPEEAADLTQYAYEQLTRKHHQVEDPSKVKGWLQSTVYRKFIDNRRKVVRFPHVEFDEEQAHAPSVASRAGEGIDALRAMEALGELEEDLRAPLSLFYLNAFSYKEIAAILDLPIGTVMSRLYRGKEKLYHLLTEKSS